MSRADDPKHPEYLYGVGVDHPVGTAAGPRTSTDDPLNEHDVAQRLDRALLRATTILSDIRQQDGDLMQLVKGSRYHTNIIDLLREELVRWQ